MIYTKHVSTRWWPSEVAIRQGFRAKTVNKRWLRKPPWTVKQPQTHKTGTFAEQNHIWVISWHNLASKHATSQRERSVEIFVIWWLAPSNCFSLGQLWSVVTDGRMAEVEDFISKLWDDEAGQHIKLVSRLNSPKKSTRFFGEPFWGLIGSYRGCGGWIFWELVGESTEMSSTENFLCFNKIVVAGV